MDDTVIEVPSGARSGNLDDLFEDVCENCAFSRFKDTGPLGECRANPPTVGVALMPKQNSITGHIEPALNPWTVFPTVERRTFCYTFEPKEADIQH